MTFLNTSKMNSGFKITIMSLFTASLIAGCGIRGNLKTPPPVFGGASKANPERVPTEDLDNDDTQDEDALDNLDFETDNQDSLSNF